MPWILCGLGLPPLRTGEFAGSTATALNCGFSGLIVNLVHAKQASAVLRGVRSLTDFDYELQMAGMNRAIYPDFETVFLTPDNALAFISSTLVREIASMRGDVSKFVHPAINLALEQRFNA